MVHLLKIPIVINLGELNGHVSRRMPLAGARTAFGIRRQMTQCWQQPIFQDKCLELTNSAKSSKASRRP